MKERVTSKWSDETVLKLVCILFIGQLFRGELNVNKADIDPVMSEQETSETKDRRDEQKDGSEKREEDYCTEKKNENEPSEIRDQDSTSAVRRNEFSILEVTRWERFAVLTGASAKGRVIKCVMRVRNDL